MQCVFFIFPFVGPVISMLLSCFSHYEFWHISINMFVLWSFMPAFESTHPLVLAKIMLTFVSEIVGSHNAVPFFISAGENEGKNSIVLTLYM